MSIRLNFCRSVPPKFLRSFLNKKYFWNHLMNNKYFWNQMGALSNPIPLVKRSSEQFLLLFLLIWKALPAFRFLQKISNITFQQWTLLEACYNDIISTAGLHFNTLFQRYRTCPYLLQVARWLDGHIWQRPGRPLGKWPPLPLAHIYWMNPIPDHPGPYSKHGCLNVWEVMFE